jgi:hypothetical protein
MPRAISAPPGLQIERIEAFGEPAVDRREKIAGLVPLIPPEPRHPHRRAQPPGILPAGRELRRAHAQNIFLLFLHQASATSAQFRRQCDRPSASHRLSIVVSIVLIASPI